MTEIEITKKSYDGLQSEVCRLVSENAVMKTMLKLVAKSRTFGKDASDGEMQACFAEAYVTVTRVVDMLKRSMPELANGDKKGGD